MGGLYASTLGSAKVDRLVLYAPVYAARNEGWLKILRSPDDPDAPNPELGACRLVTAADTRTRWDAEMPVGVSWRDEALFQALVQSSLADDPDAAGQRPPAFRAPNGTLLDLWEAFNDRPVYDAAAIRVPVLLVRGTQDPTSTRADALALSDALTSANHRSCVEIANGTHFVSAERRAPAVFAAVNGFLAPPELVVCG